MADEMMLVCNNIPHTGSKLAETYTVETTTDNKMWKEAGELACFMEGIN
ncbi:hypothetical protein ACFQGH_16255 [Halalkalicoccus tibetensis]|uniref:Uncharacterized protein n=2 Tax=Halalkalicoccus tibetensis TaxID=175632 RepID=A0ABD5V590_9EURY